MMPFPDLRKLQRQERAIEATRPRRDSKVYHTLEMLYLRKRGAFWMQHSRRLEPDLLRLDFAGARN